MGETGAVTACSNSNGFRAEVHLAAAGSDGRLAHRRACRAAGQAAKLSDLRFKGGASGYLEVLTSENDLFDAEIELAQAQLNERLAVVQLYNALGGGWKQQ